MYIYTCRDNISKCCEVDLKGGYHIYIYVHLNTFGPLELLLGSVTIFIFDIHGGMNIQLEDLFDARGRVARF